MICACCGELDFALYETDDNGLVCETCLRMITEEQEEQHAN